jgi:hypothetical protein
MSLSLEAIGSAAANDYVAGFVDASGVSRLFINESGTPLNGIADSLPQIATVVQVDDPQGGTTGPWKLHLTAQAVDTVNGSSPMTYLLDQRAYIIKASTNNG